MCFVGRSGIAQRWGVVGIAGVEALLVIEVGGMGEVSEGVFERYTLHVGAGKEREELVDG